MILHLILDAKRLHGSEIDAHGHMYLQVLSKTLLKDGTYCPPVLPSVEIEVIPFSSGSAISPLSSFITH